VFVVVWVVYQMDTWYIERHLHGFYLSGNFIRKGLRCQWV